MGWQEDELEKRNDLNLLLEDSKKRREIVTNAIMA